MIYQVEAVHIDKGQRGTLLLEAMIQANSVRECWDKAGEMLIERNIEANTVWFDVEEA